MQETSTLTDHFWVFVASALGHTLLFFLSRGISRYGNLFPAYHRLAKEQQVEWDSRVVSNIQAVLATAGAFRWLWVDWHTIEEDADFGNP